MSRRCTLKGNPLVLTGPQLKVGDTAPDAKLKKDLVSDISLSETKGKAKIFSVVPSLDTPVCAEQTRRFHKEAASLPDVSFYTISCDLPMAMSRFCGAEGIDAERIRNLSDHKDTDFGKKYGTLEISNGSIVWFPANTVYGCKMGWEQFHELMEAEARRFEKR